MSKQMGILNENNDPAMNMNRVATRQDVYISLATFIDYFNITKESSPMYLDASIVGCAARI
jgi:tellurite resistance-related uncharacterized protein